MGRKPTANLQLLPRMRKRVRGKNVYFFYDHGGKPRRETPLGKDYVQAVQRWAKLNMSVPPVHFTVGYAIAQYLVSPDFDRLKPGTQADYKFALDKLADHFSEARLEEVKPSIVQKYIDYRTRGDDKNKGSEHRAQREVSILGMIYRFAMARDWTQSNPVSSVRRKKLPGRKAIYIEDSVLRAVYACSSQDLRDAIDLAYTIGQRPVDVIGIKESQVQDGMLHVQQTKTAAKVRIPIVGELSAIIARIIERKRAFKVQPLALLVDEHGKPMTKAKLRTRFESAREKAGPTAAHFQFRDLRAKAATDIREQINLEAAQGLLGHSSVTMTEHYTRNRIGKTAGAVPEAKWKGKK